MSKQHRFLVALLGARMHYAVPCILYRAGILEHFYTDFSAAQGWLKMLNLVPKALQNANIRRVLSRVPAGIPSTRITACNTLGWRYARRRAVAQTPSEMTRTFLWANRRFGEWVSRSDWRQATAVFTFNCAGLEILQRARSEGYSSISEQTIAPHAVEQRLLREERELHPGWEHPLPDDSSAEYCQREQAEWPLANLILCGSEFVREGIRQCGGPVEKCVVVPYGVDVGPGRAVSGKRKAGGALRVLTVGAVGLRKGAPYVMAAAKELKGEVEFRWVGGVQLLPEAAAAMRQHVDLTGPVPRDEIGTHYQWADVFLLPSICEGSATVTYEAMSWGLPVVYTPNTGSVQRHGLEGFCVPIRDSKAVVGKLAILCSRPALLEEMSLAAWRRSADFTVDQYGGALLSVTGSVP